MIKKGFTLIELLVVVAVLALLASIVFSNLGGAREGAKISNALSFQSQTHSLLGSDLVGWWNFNEGSGTTARDISGYNNHGNIVGATYVDGVPGTGGTALDFNGSGNYVQLPEVTGRSISLWVKTQVISSDSWAYLLDARSGDTSGHYANRGIGTLWSNGKQYVNGVETNVSWSDFPKNEWVHLYFKSSREFTDDINLMSRYTNGETLEGLIDDVRIYSRALTASEIQTLYAQTKDNYLVNE